MKMSTTPDVMEPCLAEHRELVPHIERLRGAADAVGRVPARAAFELVDEAWRFLKDHLLVHAEAEDHVLYRAIDQVVGSPEATATMRLDHVAIAALVTELGTQRHAMADLDAISDELAQGLRRVLYGLYALVGVHFDKEEEVFVPLLRSRLSPSSAASLFEAMHRAEHAHSH